MKPEFLTVLLGSLSAVSWGSGDFIGGMATKRNNVLTVMLVSQGVGAILLVALALIFDKTLPPWSSLGWGALAGAVGIIGLALFYHALATGTMGVVAPVSAVTTALLPLGVAAVTEGAPGTLQQIGFGLALVAVWLLAGGLSTHQPLKISDLKLPVLAGITFGLFFIFIDRAGTESTFFPLLAARAASLSLMGIALLTRGESARIPLPNLPAVAAAGIFDALGNAFFVLATQAGRLDIAAMVSSLYPASTVFLAWIILKERMGKSQWTGVALALAALALISA